MYSMKRSPRIGAAQLVVLSPSCTIASTRNVAKSEPMKDPTWPTSSALASASGMTSDAYPLRLFVTPENRVFIEAALASKPSNRGMFAEAVMRSHARLTYNTVASIVVDRDARVRAEYTNIVPHLDRLHELYQVLRTGREQRGAMDFDTQETVIEYGADRKIERDVIFSGRVLRFTGRRIRLGAGFIVVHNFIA